MKEIRVSRAVCIVVAAAITLVFVGSGCDLIGGGAGSVALEYTKAFYAGTRKTSLECSGGAYNWSGNKESRYSTSNIEVRNYTVDCDDWGVSAADKANGITGNTHCILRYSRKESDDTQWWDDMAQFSMWRIHGSWCIHEVQSVF